MFVDGIDAKGRRYFEVPVFRSGPLRDAFAGADPEPCVECGAPVRHGHDRYYQRNDATDGQGDGLEAALMDLTFDTVCGACADRAFKDDAT